MTLSRTRPPRPTLFPTLLKQCSGYGLAFGLMVAAAFAFASMQTSAKPTASAHASNLLQPATGQKLAHRVVSGELGPFNSVQVYLLQSDSVDDAPYTGKVALRDGAGKVVSHVLPAPDETEANFLMKVRAVIFRNVDADPARELIVLHSSTRIGPQQPVEYGACVYRWDGQAFVRMADVEARLVGVRTAAEVNARLAVGHQANPAAKAGGKP